MEGGGERGEENGGVVGGEEDGGWGVKRMVDSSRKRIK